MKIGEVVGILEMHGIVLVQVKPIQYGTQLVFSNGSKVSVYSNGNVNVQGAKFDAVNSILKPYRDAELPKLRQPSRGQDRCGERSNALQMPELSEEDF